MIHKYISSKVLIEKIYDEYNVQSDDFAARLSTWTLNAIRELRIKQTYILENIEVEFNNNRVFIPQVVENIYGVKINGQIASPIFSNNNILKKQYTSNALVIGYDGNVYPDKKNILDLDTINPQETDLIITDRNVLGIREWNLNKINSVTTYNITNGYIHTNIEYGTCEIMGGSIPYEYDEELDILFPLIPDDEYLKNAIIQYCLANMLRRGYKHSVLNLQANNRYVNPAQAYEYYTLKARNSCNSISPSAKQSLSKILGLTIM